MGGFEYNDVNWKVFGMINSGSVLNIINVKEEYRSKLFGFLHNTLGVMNFTSKSGKIHYHIKEQDYGYSMEIVWTSTKLKSETTLSFLELLKTGEQPFEVKTEWRNYILAYLKNLTADCFEINYNYDVDDNKQYIATLKCKINFEKLYEFPKGEDIVDDDFDEDGSEFTVPYELIIDSISENIKVALTYFGNDHAKLFDTLKPIEGKEYLADFLIGATYYLYLDQPNKAYSYFKRSLNLMSEISNEISPLILDFISQIEFLEKGNPKEAEQNLIKSLLVGNQEGFLKLAYIYLQQAQNENKEVALKLVESGVKILEFDEDEEHRIAGFHIVASVYLWNNKFESAESVHFNFLSDKEWCQQYSGQVKSYLLLAVAINNNDFISNIFSDYSYLVDLFPELFNAWKYEEINPYDKKFKGEFITTMQLIDRAKELYKLR